VDDADAKPERERERRGDANLVVGLGVAVIWPGLGLWDGDFFAHGERKRCGLS